MRGMVPIFSPGNTDSSENKTKNHKCFEIKEIVSRGHNQLIKARGMEGEGRRLAARRCYNAKQKQ